MLDFELALLSHALKRFAGIFDPVLVVVAVRRQKLDDFVIPLAPGRVIGLDV